MFSWFSRGVFSAASKAKAQNMQCDSTSKCKCRNCRALMNLTECNLCCESLQSKQIQACPMCANIICIGCSVRLTSCAFCRSQLPAERNRALERLVDRLALPCKNARMGCKVVLDGESRFMHESLCNYTAIACPVGHNICGWRGSVASVKAHLQTDHNLNPLNDHGISIEIHHFRNKARTPNGRVYAVCLACYDQLFAVRVTIYQHRLRLSLMRLGHETQQALHSRPSATAMAVTLDVQAGRKLHGLIAFRKFDREPREINISCDSMYPDIQIAATDDKVRIDFQVKQITEA